MAHNHSIEPELENLLSTLDDALSFSRFSIPIRQEFMRFITQLKLDLIRGHYETSTRMDEMTERLKQVIDVSIPDTDERKTKPAEVILEPVDNKTINVEDAEGAILIDSPDDLNDDDEDDHHIKL